MVQRRHPESRARDRQTHAARSQLTLATNGYSPKESYPRSYRQHTVNRNRRFLLYEYRPIANYDSAKTSFGNTIATSRRAFSATVAARLRRREASPFTPHGCILQKLPDNREKIPHTVAIVTPHRILFCHDSVSNCAGLHWPVP